MSVATATGLTAGLAARSSSLSFEEMPGDVVELARQALIDWFGVTLAGSHEAAPLSLFAALMGEELSGAADLAGAAGSESPLRVGASAARGCGTANVIGRGVRLRPREAALVNGTASHVLDLDDVNLTLPGHVSVAVLAGALALAEQRDATGRELVTAYVTGYETACRVALAVGREPYQLGFHATGTIGTFGSAAACAHLLGLDPGQTALALGVAASEAAGLKCNMGTMTKSLHAGRACEAGLLAAELAARGFTADPEAIEAEQGFAAVSGGSCDLEAAFAGPPGGWHLRRNLFKYHAACWFTHSAIEGLAGLRAEHGMEPERVVRVIVHVSEVELGACVIAAPRTGLEVKFSIAHLAAMALLGRETALIDQGAAKDEAVISLRERVVLAPDGVPGAPTLVEIELADGSVLTVAHDVNEPERDLARQRERLEEKFTSLAQPVLGAARSADLLQMIGRFEEMPVRAVTAAASG